MFISDISIGKSCVSKRLSLAQESIVFSLKFQQIPTHRGCLWCEGFAQKKYVAFSFLIHHTKKPTKDSGGAELLQQKQYLKKSDKLFDF